LLIAVISVLGVVPYAAIQITGIGLAFEGITGGEIPFLGGTLFFLLFLAVYTIFGGFRAVAWTDTIQGVIFFVFLWIALSQVFESPEIGGLSAVFSELAARSPSPLEVKGQAGYMGYVTWISWFLLIIPGMVAYPWIIQRFFAARNKTVIYKTAAMIPILALLTMIPPIVIGLTAIVAMPDLKSADTAMVSMLVKYAGVLLGSVLGLGAIAAAMSTIDSILLSMGSILTRDLISPNFTHLSKAQLMKWARISIGAWVVLCLAIAVWRPTLIVLLGKYDLQFIGLGLFVPLVAALFWRRATATGIISGVVLGEIAGIVAAFIWKNPFGFGLDPVIWGYLVEVPVLIVVSLQSKALAADHVGRFFEATASDTQAKDAAT
jgi:SSS family solute:Na+ symporter